MKVSLSRLLKTCVNIMLRENHINRWTTSTVVTRFNNFHSPLFSAPSMGLNYLSFYQYSMSLYKDGHLLRVSRGTQTTLTYMYHVKFFLFDYDYSCTLVRLLFFSISELILIQALSITALYCHQSGFCFRHFASGLPPPIANFLTEEIR